MAEYISTGNSELDTRLGGGIPIPNLLVLEGEHGTGKTVFLQQIAYGATGQGRRVVFFTIESTVRELLSQSRMISLDLTPAYLKGLLEIYHVHREDLAWSPIGGKRIPYIILDYIAREGDGYDVFIVDNMTAFFSYSTKEDILNFLSRLRAFSERGKLIVVTLHPNILSEELDVIVKSLCDSYIKMSVTQFGGSLVKIMQVFKLRGTENPVETMIAFDVDPAFGIKILPIALAKA